MRYDTRACCCPSINAAPSACASQLTSPRRAKLNMTLPGSAGLAPPLVIAALTSLAERLTLSVRHSTMKLRVSQRVTHG